MIRDRGNKKWVSLMLPEHVKMLRDLAQENLYEQKKQLDEQQFELMDECVMEALETGNNVMVTHYYHHRHELLIGKIHRYNLLDKELQVIDHFDEVHRILLENIADIRLAD
ncbi:YolD-like family protein [Bacillus sp. FJAT-49736]|uniref:YolD-like family protein n=1 Tax=Bacillus sp. FJAT-49736 TaxID=2833582 RepID=UPI001BC994F4|nr:YolD-like family protein [Bacillus sp. FJAT-49736]MBS4173373.1 YolD-like family protein [Bacillus sp. FJAT-49736]